MLVPIRLLVAGLFLALSGCALMGIDDPRLAQKIVKSQCGKQPSQRAFDRAVMDSRTMPDGVIRLYCGDEMRQIGL